MAPAAVATSTKPSMKSWVPVRLSGDQSAHSPLPNQASCMLPVSMPCSSARLQCSKLCDRFSSSSDMANAICKRALLNPGLSCPPERRCIKLCDRQRRTPEAHKEGRAQARYGDVDVGGLDNWVKVVRAVVAAHHQRRVRLARAAAQATRHAQQHCAQLGEQPAGGRTCPRAARPRLLQPGATRLPQRG